MGLFSIATEKARMKKKERKPERQPVASKEELEESIRSPELVSS
jgi:hypothetical protein